METDFTIKAPPPNAVRTMVVWENKNVEIWMAALNKVEERKIHNGARWKKALIFAKKFFYEKNNKQPIELMI